MSWASRRWGRKSNWWSQAGSNRRPLACHASALPAELWPHAGRGKVRTPSLYVKHIESRSAVLSPCPCPCQPTPASRPSSPGWSRQLLCARRLPSRVISHLRQVRLNLAPQGHSARKAEESPVARFVTKAAIRFMSRGCRRFLTTLNNSQARPFLAEIDPPSEPEHPSGLSRTCGPSIPYRLAYWLALLCL